MQPVPEPGQDEDRLLETRQRRRPAPGAELVAPPGHKQNQLERDVKG